MSSLTLFCIVLVIFPVAISASDGYLRMIKRGKAQSRRQDVAGDFAFALYYQNNMVLQMEPHSVILWGYGTIGATVNISVNIQDVYSTKVVKGYEGRGVWSVKIKPQPAGPSAEIQGVQDNHGMLQWILLKNLLFGDVYVCSGQSNMQLTMSMVFNSSEELSDTVNYPNVRVFTVAENFSSTPLYDVADILQPWSVPSPNNIGGKDWTYFSAVCWLYGKYLYDKLKVPIGLVATTWGGTPVESWSPPSVFHICNESLRCVHELEKQH